MSNEQEYIALYDANRELIEKPCAMLLNEARRKAFEKFKAHKQDNKRNCKSRNIFHSSMTIRVVLVSRFCREFNTEK